jgi:hypothetical protein
MDRNEAIKATKNGAIAACIAGTATLVVTLRAIATNITDGPLALWNDPVVFVDVVLLFVCAYGIYKKSRGFAVFLFVYWILSKIAIAIEVGFVVGSVSGLLSLVFLYFFGFAIQGAFRFHKIEKAENQDYKPTAKWVLYTGISLSGILIALIALGLIVELGDLPPGEVQVGTEVSQDNKDLLITYGITSESDRIEYFYSTGFSSILEGGTILTKDKVILYWPDENQELQRLYIYLYDIASLELIEKGNFLNDSRYRINLHATDASIPIELSTSNGGDLKFIQALQLVISSATLE